MALAPIDISIDHIVGTMTRSLHAAFFKKILSMWRRASAAEQSWPSSGAPRHATAIIGPISASASITYFMVSRYFFGEMVALSSPASTITSLVFGFIRQARCGGTNQSIVGSVQFHRFPYYIAWQASAADTTVVFARYSPIVSSISSPVSIIATRCVNEAMLYRCGQSTPAGRWRAVA